MSTQNLPQNEVQAMENESYDQIKQDNLTPTSAATQQQSTTQNEGTPTSSDSNHVKNLPFRKRHQFSSDSKTVNNNINNNNNNNNSSPPQSNITQFSTTSNNNVSSPSKSNYPVEMVIDENIESIDTSDGSDFDNNSPTDMDADYKGEDLYQPNSEVLSPAYGSSFKRKGTKKPKEAKKSTNKKKRKNSSHQSNSKKTKLVNNMQNMELEEDILYCICKKTLY